MSKLGIQLYSIKDVGDPLPDVIEYVGNSAFDGVEFAGLGDTEVATIADALEANDVSAAGAHVGSDAIESDIEAIADTYRRLDCDRIVLPWLDEDHFTDLEAVEATARRLDDIGTRFAEHGIQFYYHNHDQELVELSDGRPALEALVEATDVVEYEFDLGWIGAAGYDPVSFFERHASSDIVHLKDYVSGTRDGAEIMDGDLDVEACVNVARTNGVEWVVYEEFLDGIVDYAEAIAIGPGLGGADMGPHADQEEYESTLEYVEIAKSEGSKLLSGGAPVEGDEYETGYFVEPTVFADVESSMRIACEEVFGPVLAVIPVADFEEAIAVANDSDYGLSASILTEHLSEANEFVDRIEAGVVKVNEKTTGLELHVPFGGVKDSSTNTYREQGDAAIDFYTTTKTVYTNY